MRWLTAIPVYNEAKHLQEVLREVRRYSPLLEYGGWGVRLGPKGWAYITTGNQGVQLRLRRGRPVLIGSAHAHELEAAIRAGLEKA